MISVASDEDGVDFDPYGGVKGEHLDISVAAQPGEALPVSVPEPELAPSEVPSSSEVLQALLQEPVNLSGLRLSYPELVERLHQKAAAGWSKGVWSKQVARRPLPRPPRAVTSSTNGIHPAVGSQPPLPPPALSLPRSAEPMVLDVPSIPPAPEPAPLQVPLLKSIAAPLALLRDYLKTGKRIGHEEGYLEFEEDGVMYPWHTPAPMWTSRNEGASRLNLASLWLSMKYKYHTAATPELLEEFGAVRVGSQHLHQLVSFLDGRADWCPLLRIEDLAGSDVTASPVSSKREGARPTPERIEELRGHIEALVRLDEEHATHLLQLRDEAADATGSVVRAEAILLRRQAEEMLATRLLQECEHSLELVTKELSALLLGKSLSQQAMKRLGLAVSPAVRAAGRGAVKKARTSGSPTALATRPSAQPPQAEVQPVPTTLRRQWQCEQRCYVLDVAEGLLHLATVLEVLPDGLVRSRRRHHDQELEEAVNPHLVFGESLKVYGDYGGGNWYLGTLRSTVDPDGETLRVTIGKDVQETLEVVWDDGGEVTAWPLPHLDKLVPLELWPLQESEPH